MGQIGLAAPVIDPLRKTGLQVSEELVERIPTEVGEWVSPRYASTTHRYVEVAQLYIVREYT